MIDFPATEIKTPIIQRHYSSDILYGTNFSAATDIDEDLWPDNWEQFYGPGYPRYMQIRIASRRTLFGSNCLEIPILRGGAVVFTPQARTVRGLTYVGNAYILSQGLQHNRVFISLSQLDSDGRILETTISEIVTNTNGWTRLTTAPILAEHPDAYTVALGIHVVPIGRQDLTGLVEIGQISVSEQPTIQFDKNKPWQVYTMGEDVEISGRITALSSSWNGARLEIHDAYERVLESRPVAKPEGEMDATGERKADNGSPNIGQYEFRWSPTISTPGYYSVRLSLPMPGIEPYTLEPRGTSQSTSFVLVNPYGSLPGGNFGWSLPERMTIDECTALKPLLANAGISLLKYPVWLDASVPETLWQKHLRFCEWLVGQNIQGVGILAVPPDSLLNVWQRDFKLMRNGVPVSVRSREGQSQTGMGTTTKPQIVSANASARPEIDVNLAGNIFNLPQEMWLPSIETTIFRLGMVVSNWQLGGDSDMSLTEYDYLDMVLAAIHSRLNEGGLDASVGLPWDWVYPFPQYWDEQVSSQTSPQSPLASRGFLSLDNEWPLTADDLAYYLDATHDSSVMRFVEITPINKRRYSLDERICDLVQRLIAARENEADAVFLPHPFDADHGVFDLAGKPGELFLPWRTSALMISGRQSLGGFNMPGGSENHLFRKPGETIMVVWNPKETDENLFLGKGCQIVDVWGKETLPEVDNHRQSLRVGPVPIFVRNIDHDVAMIRQNCRLEDSNIPSRYGEAIANKLYFTNTTDSHLNGQLTLIPPEGVEVRPKTISLNLMNGETLEQDLEFSLTARATSGPQMLLVQATTNMTNARIFDIFHPVDIGGGDISIDISTRLNRNDELEVQQAFINDGEDIVSFTCTLYTPNRPLQKMQVRNQGFGRSDYTYTIPNGRTLIGKTLRVVAKDNNSRRTLKYEIKIEP